LLKVLMVGIFPPVGVLECVSIPLRPIAISFRLYGNMYAGENMLGAMANLVDKPAWLHALCAIIVPIPFYFMEIFVGLIQALVFMLLTACFTLLICQQEEGHGVHHH